MQDVVQYYDQINQLLLSKNIQSTLTVVNDGSPKDLQADFKSLQDQIAGVSILQYQDNKGKGHALRYGIDRVEADYYVITDNDFPYLAKSMMAVIDKLITEDNDAIIGIRDADYYGQIPLKRRVISQVLRFTNEYLLRLKISDTQCGLKAFNNEAKALFVKTSIDRFLYDIEFIKLLSRTKGIKIAPQVVYLREQIILSSVGMGSLVSEMKDYMKLMFR